MYDYKYPKFVLEYEYQYWVLYLWSFASDKGGGKCDCRLLSVCQSVSKIRLLKNAWMDCMSTDVRTWKNWLTFEADPDHSPDARTGLLSPISYALQRSEFYYVGKIPRIGIEHGYSPPVAAWFWGVERPLSEVNPLYRVSFVLVRTLT